LKLTQKKGQLLFFGTAEPNSLLDFLNLVIMRISNINERTKKSKRKFLIHQLLCCTKFDPYHPKRCFLDAKTIDKYAGSLSSVVAMQLSYKPKFGFFRVAKAHCVEVENFSIPKGDGARRVFGVTKLIGDSADVITRIVTDASSKIEL
ncbi:hypothetical protein L9F63_001965, partial [Diploptera punctata]